MVKNRKIGTDRELSTPPYLASLSSVDSGSPLITQYSDIPPVELMKAWESILDQVDWSEMVENGGGRERPDINLSKDRNIEFGKGDDGDIDAESGNDNKEDSGDGFRHFEDNTFLESEESVYGSEEYTDDGTGDEEDSDEDDDCEVIDDWLSV